MNQTQDYLHAEQAVLAVAAGRRLARAQRVWLMGVRRAGKTVLGQSVPDSEYLDCELPSVRRRLEDPESASGSMDWQLN